MQSSSRFFSQYLSVPLSLSVSLSLSTLSCRANKDVQSAAPVPEKILFRKAKVNTFSIRADGKSVKFLATACTTQTCIVDHCFCDCCAVHSSLAVQWSFDDKCHHTIRYILRKSLNTFQSVSLFIINYSAYYASLISLLQQMSIWKMLWKFALSFLGVEPSSVLLRFAN